MEKISTNTCLFTISLGAILFFVTTICLAASVSFYYYKKNKLSRLTHCRSEAFLVKTGITNPSNKTIVLLGDSRIEQWNKPTFGVDITVLKFGIPGGTTKEVLCSIDANVMAIRPTWYIVQVGINDLVAARMVNNESSQKIHNDAFSNIQAIVEKLSSTGSNVLLMTVVPPIAPDILRRIIWGSELEQDVERLSRQILDCFPKNLFVLDMKKIFYDENSHCWRTEMASNALHWTSAAYESLNKDIAVLVSNKSPHPQANTP
jgi:lysophospholipase L1-like esterase